MAACDHNWREVMGRKERRKDTGEVVFWYALLGCQKCGVTRYLEWIATDHEPRWDEVARELWEPLA